MNWYKRAALPTDWEKDALYHVFMMITTKYPQAADLSSATTSGVFYVIKNEYFKEFAKHWRQRENLNLPIDIFIFYNSETYINIVRKRDKDNSVWLQGHVRKQGDEDSIRSILSNDPYDYVTQMEQAIVDLSKGDDSGGSKTRPEQPYSPSGIKIPQEEELIAV